MVAHLVGHVGAKASKEVQHGYDIAPVVSQGAPQTLYLQGQLISVPSNCKAVKVPIHKQRVSQWLLAGG
jgi:hypothetical protein